MLHTRTVLQSGLLLPEEEELLQRLQDAEVQNAEAVWQEEKPLLRRMLPAQLLCSGSLLRTHLLCSSSLLRANLLCSGRSLL